jgi:phenylpropionate dioxygenase-like ring-hydroxylating dioxygenase large terminal subunit
LKENAMNALVDQGLEQYLNLGVRDAWYPVLPSWRVHDAAVGITRLGDNLVIWRDAAGALHAIEDRCPHRGARISLGWNLGDRLACWYHGIQVSGEGKVVEVPAYTECPMKDEKSVRTYPVQELNNAIFVWFGATPDTPPAKLELPEQLASPEWAQMLCTSYWGSNYRYAIDNVMDPMHGAFLHAQSHSMADGEKQAQMRTRKTPSGLVFEKVGQTGVNFDWVEWGESGGFWMRLSIPYRKKYGPGGQFYIVGFATPVDANNTLVFFWRCRKVEGWQRDLWKFMYKNRLEGLHWEVLEQDRLILEDMAPDARGGEFLYQHDTGLVHIRRRMETLAREQLKRRAEQSTERA